MGKLVNETLHSPSENHAGVSCIVQDDSPIPTHLNEPLLEGGS